MRFSIGEETDTTGNLARHSERKCNHRKINVVVTYIQFVQIFTGINITGVLAKVLL